MLPRYASAAFDLIDTLQQQSGTAAVIERLGEALKQFGFHAFLITGLPLPGRKLEPYILLNGWPSGWYSRYVAKNYVHTDPVARNCYSTVDPFLWSDVTSSNPLSRPAQGVMDEATEFDMREGIVVPIFDSAGFQAAVTMAGGKLELPVEARPAIHLMAIYAHARVRQLICDGLNDCETPSCEAYFSPLTDREREILQWTAMGKTAWEISRILSISRRTVEDHLFHVRNKLDTATSTQAVVEAIRLRLIRL